jgi:hypothetical protein
LVHLVGLGLVVRQRRAVGVGQCAGLDQMPEPKQVLAADPHLTGELRGGRPLGDAADDQEDLCGAQVGSLPGCAGEHVEHPAAAFAAVIDDRGVGTTAVDVEPLPSATTGTGMPIGVEQVEELLAAALLVHQVDDREVHAVGSKGTRNGKPDDQKNRSERG